MKVKPQFVILLLFFLSGCCSKEMGCSNSSNCPCKSTYPDVYQYVSSKHAETIGNLNNRQFRFRNEKGDIDTISFNNLKYRGDTYADASYCSGAHHTCCQKVHGENYTLDVQSTKAKNAIQSLYLSSAMGKKAEVEFQGVTGGLYFTENLLTVTYQNQLFEDTFFYKSKTDTLSLVSVSGGILIYTDKNQMKWNRML